MMLQKKALKSNLVRKGFALVGTANFRCYYMSFRADRGGVCQRELPPAPRYPGLAECGTKVPYGAASQLVLCCERGSGQINGCRWPCYATRLQVGTFVGKLQLWLVVQTDGALSTGRSGAFTLITHCHLLAV